MEQYAYDILKTGVQITPSEVYDMTIPEISSVLDGWRNNMKHQKMFFGTLTASVYNTSPNRKRSAKLLNWADIYPSNDNGSYHANREMTNDEIKSKLKLMFGGTT